MVKLFTQLGKCEEELEGKYKTFEDAYKIVLRYYHHYGNNNKLYKDGAMIICNNEPMLRLKIR